jgi:hypothetical protein
MTRIPLSLVHAADDERAIDQVGDRIRHRCDADLAGRLDQGATSIGAETRGAPLPHWNRRQLGYTDATPSRIASRSIGSCIGS